MPSNSLNDADPENPPEGPPTDETNRNSSRDHYKSGLCGRFRFLESEDPQQFHKLLAALIEEHKPETTFETVLVSRMAEQSWLVQRAQILHANLLKERDEAGADGGEHGASAYPHAERDRDRLSWLYIRYGETNSQGARKSLEQLHKMRAHDRKHERDIELLKLLKAKNAPEVAAHEPKPTMTSQPQKVEIITAARDSDIRLPKLRRKF